MVQTTFECFSKHGFGFLVTIHSLSDRQSVTKTPGWHTFDAAPLKIIDFCTEPCDDDMFVKLCRSKHRESHPLAGTTSTRKLLCKVLKMGGEVSGNGMLLSKRTHAQKQTHAHIQFCHVLSHSSAKTVQSMHLYVVSK